MIPVSNPMEELIQFQDEGYGRVQGSGSRFIGQASDEQCDLVSLLECDSLRIGVEEVEIVRDMQELTSERVPVCICTRG
jgi:hypothetical protein